jgi:predicted RNA-binding protein
MCQISVVFEENGEQQKVMDNVTGLDVTPEGIVLATFFEEPKTVTGAAISRIDFLGGTVVLHKDPAGGQGGMA